MPITKKKIIKYPERKSVYEREGRKITVSKSPTKNRFLVATQNIEKVKAKITTNLKHGNIIEAVRLYIILSKSKNPKNTIKNNLDLIETQLHNLEVSKLKRKAIESDKTINAKQKELYLKLTSKQIDKKEEALINEIKKKLDLDVKR